MNNNDATAGRRRTQRTVTWNIPGDEAPSHGGRERGEEDGPRPGRPAERPTVPSRSGTDPLVLSWEGLRYSVPATSKRRFFRSGDRGEAGEASSYTEGLVVLNDVSGFAGPSLSGVDEGGVALSGTVTAIMGPSGAGKTSLLNALAGRLEVAAGTRRICGGGLGDDKGLGLSGSVRINRVEVSAAVVRRLSAYVTQEDVLPETLTCHEHLMFHAYLRLPRGTSLELRRARVSQVRAELGGWGREGDARRRGGCSEGGRVRQFLPRIFFLVHESQVLDHKFRLCRTSSPEKLSHVFPPGSGIGKYPCPVCYIQNHIYIYIYLLYIMVG